MANTDHVHNPVQIVWFGPRPVIYLNKIYTWFGPAPQPGWYVEDHHDEEEDVENG